MVRCAARLQLSSLGAFLLIGALAGVSAAPATAAAAPTPTQVRDLLQAGHYAEAETAARRLLAGATRGSGPDSAAVAEACDLLSEALRRAGRAADPETRTLAERSVRIRERRFGPDSPLVADSLHTLGSALYVAGDPSAARPILERSLAIREKALGPDSPDVARSLTYLGNLLAESGETSQARGMLERAVTIREAAFGPDHLDVAESLNSLGNALYFAGDYAGARPIYERALAIRERLLPADHPVLAASVMNLARVLQVQGDDAAARPLYERALAMREAALGPDHPVVATTLEDDAGLLLEMGDRDAARPLLLRAILLREARPAGQEERLALDLERLGSTAADAGDLATARTILERALKVRQAAFGTAEGQAGGGKDARVAPALSALARLAYIERDDTRAEELCRKALAMRAGGAPAHPLDDADDLNLLTLVLLRRGKPDDALPLAWQTITLREAALGPRHPSMVWDLRNLALVESRLGHADAAIDAALRAEELSREFLRRTGRELAERQVMLVAFSQSSGLDVALDQTVAQAPAGSDGVPERTRRVWDTLVRSRARVLDEMTDRRRALQRSGDPATTQLAADLGRASATLANLLARGPAADTTERYAALVEKARGEEEQAERALARSGRSFRAEHEPAAIGLAEVQRTLGKGDAMVAFARYETPVATAPGGGPPEVGRYLAFVLRGGDAGPVAIPLGTSGEIDALVRRWRREAGHAGGAASIAVQVDEEGYRLAGDELRKRIWDPLLPQLRDVDRLFVVPDGALHLVSLAALPSTKGRYLIETGLIIHYLSAERDLATPASAGSAPARGAPGEAGGLLALGSPDFGAASESLAAATPDPAAADVSLSDASGGSVVDGASGTPCSGLGSRTFPLLPASEQEAMDVAELWNRSGSGGAVVLTGAQADESAFKAQAPGRSVLHLATHGFFLDESCGPSGNGGELQLSGLALAGANRHASSAGGGEDGVLLAEEIAAMDLSSVRWAVLSACDTGLGDIVAGEGVFGLRRAFQIAGARTVIMSLWPVGDAEGREWMRALYTARLKKGLGAAEAVRAAGLAMLRRERRTRGTSHPFPWGGFVAAGDWQ